MPRDLKRRSRRSLPSAIERNLSLHELLGDADTASSRRHATRRKSLEKQQQQELQSLNAYFAMIDGTALKVEKQDPVEEAIEVTPAASPSSSSPSDAEATAGAVSDSELVRPRATTIGTTTTITTTTLTMNKSRTQRTVRRRNLDDATLRAEYADYCDATSGVVPPVSIAEFARSIVPEVKAGMYEGILDICEPVPAL